MGKLTCATARQIDLVDYLASLGHTPAKIRNNDYWYLSPFRDEKTPSFKIDRKLNAWYDHGEGVGGNLIDFGTRYLKCSVSDMLEKLSNQPGPTFPFQPQRSLQGPSKQLPDLAGEKKGTSEGKIVVQDVRSIEHVSLVSYLRERNIPVAIARQYCQEVDFVLYNRKHTAIGFKNMADGFELRSRDFKGSSAPKAVTLVNNGQNDLSVFEGFFNFLSYAAMHACGSYPTSDFLILNSLSFFEQQRPRMDERARINLFLDQDSSGKAATQKALQWNVQRYQDQSHTYNGFKDLNDFIMARGPTQTGRTARRGRGI